MKYKKLAVSIAIATISTLPTTIYSRPIFPSDILARDLNYPGLGWLGHVGIATEEMYSSGEMHIPATLVIEVLNEPIVGQINTIINFKSRSKYWGSKWGIGDRNTRSYQALVEANHQRWWCPAYTSNTDYHVGKGIVSNSKIIECGRWRCDTYAWWAFFSQGYDTMPGRVWLPRNLFNYFPYFNDEKIKVEQHNKPSISTDRTLENVSAKELNDMPYEEFQMVMEAPLSSYVTSPSSIQLKLAFDNDLNDAKRGIMIDRLVSRNEEPDLIKKLITLYNETNNVEVKSKIVENFMLYNQQHRNDKGYISNDSAIIKDFFESLLNDKPLTAHIADTGLRGFIDTHNEDEITNNSNKINELLGHVNHHSSIMLKYALTFKSKELQKIYIKSIVDELRKVNDSDIDSYFFGPLSMAYKNLGAKLLEPESKKVVMDYLKEVGYKYSQQGIKSNPNDIHRAITAPYYFDLLKSMN